MNDTAFDPEAFKHGMRQLAGAVCVVSTSGTTGTHGLAATAVCSVCADPPTLLAIVNQSSRTHPHIHRNGTFSINILSEKQLAIAMLLSSKSDDQFAQIEHRALEDGNIQIDETLGQFHCRVVAEHNIGTHTVFVGRVLSGSAAAGNPLVYFDAKFETLKPI